MREQSTNARVCRGLPVSPHLCVCVRVFAEESECVSERDKGSMCVSVCVCEREKEREKFFALVGVFPLAVSRCAIHLWVCPNRNLGFYVLGWKHETRTLRSLSPGSTRGVLVVFHWDMGPGNYVFFREVAGKYIYLVWVYTYVYVHMYIYVYEYTCICLYVRSFKDWYRFFFESVQIQMLFSSWCQCTFFLMVHKKSYTLTNLGGSML